MINFFYKNNFAKSIANFLFLNSTLLVIIFDIKTDKAISKK